MKIEKLCWTGEAVMVEVPDIEFDYRIDGAVELILEDFIRAKWPFVGIEFPIGESKE